MSLTAGFKEPVEWGFSESRFLSNNSRDSNFTKNKLDDQIKSLTDADARLMKNKNDFAVAYNPQTTVDSETHLIQDFKMTNQLTGHGMLSLTMQKKSRKKHWM